MPTFKGQVGTLLAIQMESRALSLRWNAAVIGLGGQSELVFQTSNVGDGTPVAFQILDGEGGTWKKLKGRVVNNLAKIDFKVDPAPRGGLLIAVANIQDLGMELRSSALLLRQGVVFGDLKAKDEDGEELKEVLLGENAILEGKVRNAPPGAPVEVRVTIQLEDSHEHLVLRTRVEPDQGGAFQIKLLVDLHDGHEKDGQVVLDKFSQKYKDALLRAKFGCLGIWAGLPPVPIREDSTIQFIGAKGTVDFVLADGSKRSMPVPEDGQVLLERVPLGDIVIDGVEVADEPGGELDGSAP